MYIPDRAEDRFQEKLSGDIRYCFGKSKPKQPDYASAAEATAQGNLELLEQQTQNNRPDQFGPMGNVQWTQDADGKWTQNTNLNEDSQRGLDAQLGLGADRSELAGGMFGRVKDEMSQPFDWDGLPQVGDGAGARQRGEDAIYGRHASRLDTEWGDREDSQRARLAAQGLRPGDAAYDKAVARGGTERNDAYDRARTSAISAGGVEGQRQHGMEVGDRNRVMGEEMKKRGFSLNEINQLLAKQGANTNTGVGDFQKAGLGTGVDHTGAAQNQYAADANNASMTNQNTQGLMQAGAMAYGMGMFCDRRLKRNITLIGTFKQYPLYLFQYIWGQWAVGPMSDEINQDAVTRLPNGYDWVNIARIT